MDSICIQKEKFMKIEKFKPYLFNYLIVKFRLEIKSTLIQLKLRAIKKLEREDIGC